MLMSEVKIVCSMCKKVYKKGENEHSVYDCFFHLRSSYDDLLEQVKELEIELETTREALKIAAYFLPNIWKQVEE